MKCYFVGCVVILNQRDKGDIYTLFIADVASSIFKR
jgi:hypothetical protein